MIKWLDDPAALEEHMALITTSCFQCDRSIEIGDDCYVDNREGPEEPDVKIFCKICYDEAIMYP